jgi:septum formation protein
MDRYILASNSPRRRELLRLVISDYEVIPSEGEEIISSTEPDKVVEELSLQKAMDVAGKVRPCEGDRIIVIGADTVVAVDREILGKPEDRTDAGRMIAMIQGREHHVYTGVTVCVVDGTSGDGFLGDGTAAAGSDGVPEKNAVDGTSADGTAGDGTAAADWDGAREKIRHFSFSEETVVDVFPMNRGEIEGYISLEEPYDKAGAYGIQGAFSIFIRGIRGDYNNVVGLPAARLYHELARRNLL